MNSFDDYMHELLKQGRNTEAVKLLGKREEWFWKEEYPNKSREEKIKYWSGSLHQQMRWNGESGQDEMAIFSKEDYMHWKLKEPEIEKLLPEILKMLNISIDKVYPLLGI